MKIGLGTGHLNSGGGGGGGIGHNAPTPQDNAVNTENTEQKPQSIQEVITPTGEWYDNEFLNSLTDFSNAVQAWKDPELRTQRAIAALADARGKFEPHYRQLYKLIKASPLITKDDLSAMGLPWQDNIRTLKPITQKIAEIKVGHPSVGVVEIRFRGENKAKWGKEDGVHGAEIAWAILSQAPTDWHELIHSSFDTASPYLLSFPGEDLGKTLYFAIRWENGRGDKGPWSAIQKVVIS
ncbi:MAG: hypothetical protein LBH04_07040 [Tannerellaceae bacterium]|nr:hypothetical protein [Tannerellaceae bacterium]